MKRLFWFLVILNLGLLVYYNMGIFMQANPAIKLTEIQPEKIKILTANEIAALPKKTAVLPESATGSVNAQTKICYEWGTFSDTELPRAQNALLQLELQAQVKNLSANQPQRYWVYRPPFGSHAEAQKKANEFKALGVNDLFVVQENKWKYAISFGIFEDEQLADKLIEDLQTKGIRNIKKTVRGREKIQHSLLFNPLSADDLRKIDRLQPDFPATKVTQESCDPE